MARHRERYYCSLLILYLGVVEVGGELHEDGRDKGRHVIGEGLHKGAEAEDARVMLQSLVLK